MNTGSWILPTLRARSRVRSALAKNTGTSSAKPDVNSRRTMACPVAENMSLRCTVACTASSESRPTSPVSSAPTACSWLRTKVALSVSVMANPAVPKPLTSISGRVTAPAAAGPNPNASASVAVVIAGERYIRGPRVAQGEMCRKPGSVWVQRRWFRAALAPVTGAACALAARLFYTVWWQSRFGYKMSVTTYTVRESCCFTV